MARHISTKEILDHFRTATAASVNGTIYKNIVIDDEKLTIGPWEFPLDYFDIGGINPHTIQLMDKDQEYHDIMLLGKDGYKLDHPKWNHEPYDPYKLRNADLAANHRTKMKQVVRKKGD